MSDPIQSFRVPPHTRNRCRPGDPEIPRATAPLPSLRERRVGASSSDFSLHRNTPAAGVLVAPALFYSIGRASERVQATHA